MNNYRIISYMLLIAIVTKFLETVKMAELRHSAEQLLIGVCFVIIFMAFTMPMNCVAPCPPKQFMCDITKCIHSTWRCDGQYDCEDKSDEEQKGFCQERTRICPKDQFRCDDGHCLKSKWACDGNVSAAECKDGSDEWYCVNASKGWSLRSDTNFRCFNGLWIIKSLKCNGENDCGDWSDELYCDNTNCQDFQCITTLECISKNKKCDLKHDCEDKTDEMDCPPALDVSMDNNTERITVGILGVAKWKFNVTSNTEKFRIIWEKILNKTIVRDTGKYKVLINQKNALLYEIVLQIRDIVRRDEGHYTLQVKLDGANGESKLIYLYLGVIASGSVTIDSNDQVNFWQNHKYNITCTVSDSISPQWTFQTCFTETNCSNPRKVSETSSEKIGRSIISTLEFLAVEHGVYKCSIDNSGGNDMFNIHSDAIKIRIVDFPGNDAISIVKPAEIVDGEDVSIICSISTLYTSEEPQWYQVLGDGNLEKFNKTSFQYSITTNVSKWSHKSTLKLVNLRLIVAPNITIRCKSKGVDALEATIDLKVLSTEKPKFINTNLQNASTILTRGDRAELICNVSGRPKPEILWTWGNLKIIQSRLNYTLSDDKSILFLNDVTDDVKGTFQCTAENQVFDINGAKKRMHCLAFTKIIVEDGTPPEFIHTNLANSNRSVKMGETLQLICNVTGRPKPRITWLWNNESSWPSSINYTKFEDGQFLLLHSIPKEAKGRFTCTAENMQGKITTYIDIVVIATETGNAVDLDMVIWIVGPIGTILGILVLVFGTLMLRYKWRQRKLFRFLNELSEKEFYEGAVENINPDLSVSDQAYLLPFQQTTWEIPRNDLKLGIPLGSGAFGLVLKAQAFGVVEGEESTTVAVKTVKGNADETHFKALMTELKIMAHLGKHLNIVNLIGACTKNLAKKKELLVVMEFCKYGSIQTYMLRNKRSFINQLDPKTDKIDPSIGVRNDGQANATERCVDFDGNQQVEASNGYLLENCNEDYQRSDTTPIKSTDLLSWAFQTAKGMEYLSARKVLHGDLAARNVLLADNNIVKICDFGYARETFKNYNYKKDTKGVLLPIKWMAIESVYCGEFSSKSDCWSFGILIWELFTLGNEPYPGMEVNEDFCQRINDGYRMEKPEYAPTSVYHIMKECWAHEPSDRPSFSQLSDKLGELISKWVRDRILDLNESYSKLNIGKSQEADYLLRMGGQDFCGEKSLEPSSSQALTAQRYQEVPSASSPQNTEPTCTISMETKRNSKCKYVKPRPDAPPRKM